MTTPGLLAGITVLDFSRVLAGPMATQILAELGATVIKVERPGRGDETRDFQPTLPHGESAYFFAFNRSKKSITLDLKHERGKKIARQLAKTADVVVENFLPGHMDRMGLGYDALSADNKALVYVSNTGFGQSGPNKDVKGYDTIFQAMSGIMDLTGHPDAPPAKAGIPLSDMTSGLWIVIGALAGLASKAATGRGAHIDVAMMDVQVSLLALAAARVFANNENPTRVGTEHLGRVPSAAFECLDGGWLHISGSDAHWLPLCEVLALDELAAAEELRANSGRVQHRELVMTALRAAIGGRYREELAKDLRSAGVPIGEIRSVREVLDHNNTEARRMIGTFDHPTEGEFPAIRTPLAVGGDDGTQGIPPMQAPPLLGADTDHILRTVLELGDHEIAALHEEGTI